MCNSSNTAQFMCCCPLFITMSGSSKSQCASEGQTSSVTMLYVCKVLHAIYAANPQVFHHSIQNYFIRLNKKKYTLYIANLKTNAQADTSDTVRSRDETTDDTCLLFKGKNFYVLNEKRLREKNSLFYLGFGLHNSSVNRTVYNIEETVYPSWCIILLLFLLIRHVALCTRVNHRLLMKHTGK